jgi:hypothetical protein
VKRETFVGGDIAAAAAAAAAVGRGGAGRLWLREERSSLAAC